MITHEALYPMGFRKKSTVSKHLLNRKLPYKDWEILYYKGTLYLNKGTDLTYLLYGYPGEDVWFKTLGQMKKVPIQSLNIEGVRDCLGVLDGIFKNTEKSIEGFFTLSMWTEK